MKCPVCDTDLARLKPRSTPQHRRFFGLIKAAYHHWPETHDFKPESPEHLRAWLLIKAGHADATDVQIEWGDDQPGLTKLAALTIEMAIKAAGSYAFTRPHPKGGWIRVFKPQSISYAELGHNSACVLFDDVAQIITSEIGIDAETLLRETEQAA